jgi:hypothetical protein
MRIVASSDWRDGLAFEVPVLVSEVSAGEDARCFVCGADSAPIPRTELWAVKHRHPKNHSGYVRFYCLEHRPAPPRPTSTVDARRASSRTGERRAAPRRSAPAVERPSALCPDCFVEVPATGVCGICGNAVFA